MSLAKFLRDVAMATLMCYAMVPALCILLVPVMGIMWLLGL